VINRDFDRCSDGKRENACVSDILSEYRKVVGLFIESDELREYAYDLNSLLVPTCDVL
jgi:hypothetical protein